MVRRVAFELLNKKDEPNFINMLKEFYIILGNSDLEPYWEESNEEEFKEVIIIPKEDEKDGPKQMELSHNLGPEYTKPELNSKQESTVKRSQPDEELEKRFDRLEKEVLEQEIKDLKMLLKEKSNKIKEITKQLTEQQSEIIKIEEWKHQYEKFKKENEILTTNINNLTELSNQQNEKIDSQTEKLNQIMEDLNDKNIQIVNFQSELEKSKDQINESEKQKLTILRTRST